MQFLSTVFVWASVCLLLLNGCTGSNESDAAQLDGAVDMVSIGFGEEMNRERGLIQTNTIQVKSLQIQTLPSCGGSVKQIQSNQNPAVNIPICKTAMDQLKLLKVDFDVTSSQGTKAVSLDLSSPQLYPLGMTLQRYQSGAKITYLITDAGGSIVNNVSLISYFVNASLAVNYLDKHFLENVTYDKLSSTLLKAIFTDCSDCLVSAAESTLPAGIKISESSAGSLVFDTSAAPNGTHEVALVVFKEAFSTDRVAVNLSLSIQHVEESLGPAGPPGPSGVPFPSGSPFPTSDVDPTPVDIENKDVWEPLNCNVDGTCNYRNKITGETIRIKHESSGGSEEPLFPTPAPTSSPVVILKQKNGNGSYMASTYTVDSFKAAKAEAASLGIDVLVVKLGNDPVCGPCRDLTAELLKIAASPEQPKTAFLFVSTKDGGAVVDTFRALEGPLKLSDWIPQTYYYFRDTDGKWYINSTVEKYVGAATINKHINNARAQIGVRQVSP